MPLKRFPAEHQTTRTAFGITTQWFQTETCPVCMREHSQTFRKKECAEKTFLTLQSCFFS